jgi:hypothetical protein
MERNFHLTKIVLLLYFKNEVEIGMVGHVCNFSTLEAEAGGLGVQGQLGLYRETQQVPLTPAPKKRENEMEQ